MKADPHPLGLVRTAPLLAAVCAASWAVLTRRGHDPQIVEPGDESALEAAADACPSAMLHEVTTVGPVAAWRRSDTLGGWVPAWGAVRPRTPPPCPPRCTCERHDVEGTRWPTRREFIEAAGDDGGARSDRARRFDFEADAGLRHDDEIVHDAAPSPGKTGCRYCEFLLRSRGP